ncbi:efflux RND transporter periplasmic adaptor subunit [Thiohalocapsa marina]|uniref:efflux RND transporter periplasmic adaptor subunit n=1 Tax=Thiohalocapsa marina TaxID=424902 RepID=UPI001FEBACCE|nr:efflux RND transporter periplasmic adaptor subunit [Thiohalocapsa marina]
MLGPLLATLLVALPLAGCRQEPAPAPPSQPPSVVAVKAVAKPIEQQASFVGRVVAVNRVELRARVEGFLDERRFTEGQPVKTGDLLFLIEPDQYQAAVEQRQADVQKAEADQLNTSAQLKRGQELLADDNIAQAKVDELQAADSIAKANIAQAQAALNQAKLDLSYTRIVAPVDGRIGLASYTVGNLVGPSSGTLATIVSRDPIYVEFPVTQRELLEARETIEQKGGNAKNVQVRVRLPDGSLYEQVGYLDFVNVTTDPETDSVTLRASLPNADGTLVDRQYVGVLLQSGTPTSAILIPQSALQFDQQGQYVMIIDADGKAQVRRVETGQARGTEVIVSEGLKAGELVITQGIQKVRPGQAVKATPAPAETAASKSTSASADTAAPAAAKGDTP